MTTELLMASEEQEKIAFKENRTHYLLVGWGGNFEKGMEIRNMEQLRLEATSGHGLVQSLCSKQSFLEQVVPDLVQLGFVYLQVWRLGSLSGQPVPLFGYPHHGKILPCVQRELNCSCTSVCFPSFLSCWGTPNQEFGSVSFTASHQRSLVEGKTGAAAIKGTREDESVGNADKQGTDRVAEEHSNVGPSNTADLNELQVTSLDA